MPKFELTTLNAISRQPTIINDPVEVDARLQELHPDLNSALLRDALLAGLGARNETTRASAPTAPGLQHWLKTVESLRTSLAMGQWNIHDYRNCPFISSPDRTISIVVMTGDKETGSLKNPTNQAEKGAVAEGFVKNNQQLELFNSEFFEFAKNHRKETQVWVLLYHYDKALNEIRYEFSLPTGFDNKKITDWEPRLILESISNNPEDFQIHKDEPNVSATVEVAPKTGTF